MKHASPTWVRKGKTLRPADPTDITSKTQTFQSISMAKKASLQLQMSNGGRGCGYVRVAKGK